MHRIAIFPALVLLAGCGGNPAALQTSTVPVTYRGIAYKACQDDAQRVQTFEASGRHKVTPKSQADKDTFSSYVIAKQKLAFAPHCASGGGNGGDVGAAASFFSALASTTPPHIAKRHKWADTVYQKSVLVGGKQAQVDAAIANGMFDELCAAYATFHGTGA